MNQLDSRLIAALRSSARRGETPSRMLRDLIAALAAVDQHPVTAVLYCSAAFCFGEGEAHPIFGWNFFEAGSLSDERLDQLLTPRIRASADRWDAEPVLAR